ncbi:Phospholipase/lecithinase/hemolysin [Acidisarcina polymorpha]|uniref:Phospholipase/lecithinase/hemolysin n=1 Tax=Acidisarcina polymorpha TaxID=2211140 RepID=A0A2Z5G0B3_9BACT|nr:SGNH/GDSL hydrolase family protein [Acidisarcina polymorpha]AXC12568.1 Phospholipase/lecithinase/hemolysin [Acidisarcina polymorpha]
MPFRSLARAIAMLSLAAFGSLAAHAYDSIVVFGDSYNDVGNIYAASTALHNPYPPAPYYKGRFSNGPIWVEHIASDWGLPITPSLLGGTDFAFGGAELLKPVVVEGLPIPSVPMQVDAYLALNHGKADPNALYVLEGGGNDILNATEFDPGKLGCAIATGIYELEKKLRGAGAKNFLVPDMINVGQLPAAGAGGAAFIKFASDTSIHVNWELAGLLDADMKLPGIHIYRLPVFQTFLAVGNATTHFGFTNVTTPCLSETLTVCSDPDHTLWWDAEHPTAFGHAFFAVLVEGRVPNQ